MFKINVPIRFDSIRFFLFSIKGEQEYIYSGERVRDELLAFAYRMSGPPVQLVTQIDSFDMLKGQNELFFTYVGQRNGSLWNSYFKIAENFQPHSNFYATSRELAKPHFQVDTLPVVLVYKENSHYHFPRKNLQKKTKLPKQPLIVINIAFVLFCYFMSHSF